MAYDFIIPSSIKFARASKYEVWPGPLHPSFDPKVGGQPRLQWLLHHENCKFATENDAFIHSNPLAMKKILGKHILNH